VIGSVRSLGSLFTKITFLPRSIAVSNGKSPLRRAGCEKPDGLSGALVEDVADA
jgi:hypothetical protein